MDLFSKEYQDHVQKMRKKFFQSGSIEGITGVRPEILDCWQIAYMNEVRPENARKSVASAEDLAFALKDSADLLEVAEPYMQLLHSFLEPDSFWIGLMDRNDIIVRIVASPLVLKMAKSTQLVVGSYRGDTAYPGMYSICRKLDRPFRIVSGEHPARIDDALAGAAAPIHDRSTGQTLGVIGISGYFEKSHEHTLGLTIMAAEAIAQGMELKKIIRKGALKEETCGNCGVYSGANNRKRTGDSGERDALLALLRQHHGNISEVARVLGVSRPTIYRKMKKCGIDPEGKWMHY